MRRALLSLSIACLLVSLISCSRSSEEAKPTPIAPVTPKDTTAAPAKPTPPTTAPTTTTTLPLILDVPSYQEYCSKEYPFCVEFPTDGEVPEPRSYDAGEVTASPLYSIDVMYGIDLATGKLCTEWYKEHLECKGFDHMSYWVSAQPMPDKTADEALSEWLEKSKQSMHALNYTTYAGSPAATGQFGQLGTYTAVYHNGVLYQISTNGQEGRPYGEQRFLDSFRFTDTPAS